MAGYIAGTLVIGVSTIYSFVGHKEITFRTKSGG
jgi:putative flippase GtrA